MKKGINNQGEGRFERLLKLYLNQRSFGSDEGLAEHLDEDILTAFVEGRLNQLSNLPIVSHLVDCSVCRRTAFELIKISEGIDDRINSDASIVIKSNALNEILNNLKDKAFKLDDLSGGAVFAHQESVEDCGDDKRNEEEQS